MIDAAVLLFSLAGFVLLLLAMPRHQTDWCNRRLSKTMGRVLRLSGFAILGLAFTVAGAGSGWGYGAVAWFGWLSVAAALVVAAHANRQRIMRKWHR